MKHRFWRGSGEYSHAHRLLVPLTQTDVWQGSVQAPGLSLSHRLPTLVVWLSFGPRSAGVARPGEAQEGFAQLEVALPSRLDNHIGSSDGSWAWNQHQNVS